jgi:hypothetical protein
MKPLDPAIECHGMACLYGSENTLDNASAGDAEISGVARPSADKVNDTDILGAANDGCVVTMALVSLTP